MYVSDVALTDFRSYETVVLQLPPGVVVFEGNNGRGKTNLVEGLAYLSAFSSHRSTSSKQLVRIDRTGENSPTGAVIRARVALEERSHLLELEISRGRANRGRLNKVAVPPRDLLGILRTVVSAPEDLLVLRGDPGGRRKFLDEIATMLKPHYRGIIQEYEKVARQRAATLKQLGSSVRRGKPLTDEQQVILEVWDKKLGELSADVIVHRLAVVEAMGPLATRIYNDVTADDRHAELEYTSTLFTADGEPGPPQPEAQARPAVKSGRIEEPTKDQRSVLVDNFLEQASQKRADELRRGVNLIGAHRDDLEIRLDGLPVKGYASHGELWSSALMLRLAELEILKEEDRTPVLILDDVFAELDEGRRSRLAEMVAGVRQVIITSAVAEDLPEGLEGHHFRVHRGKNGASEVEDLRRPRPTELGTSSEEAAGA